MVDEKQTPTTEEHPTPKVSSPAEHPAAETAIPEQTHDSAYNVIPFDGSGEENLEAKNPFGEEDDRQEWEKASAELAAEQKKLRRGRPPKMEKVKQIAPKADKTAQDGATPPNETKRPEVKRLPR